MNGDPPNSEKMRFLFSKNIIRAKESCFLYSNPEIIGDIDRDRIEGMLLGVAIGDSLGYPVESLLPKDKLNKYGEIRNYIPSRRSDHKPVGVPTDDTQMAFWTS